MATRPALPELKNAFPASHSAPSGDTVPISLPAFDTDLVTLPNSTSDLASPLPVNTVPNTLPESLITPPLSEPIAFPWKSILTKGNSSNRSTFQETDPAFGLGAMPSPVHEFPNIVNPDDSTQEGSLDPKTEDPVKEKGDLTMHSGPLDKDMHPVSPSGLTSRSSTSLNGPTLGNVSTEFTGFKKVDSYDCDATIELTCGTIQALATDGRVLREFKGQEENTVDSPKSFDDSLNLNTRSKAEIKPSLQDIDEQKNSSYKDMNIDKGAASFQSQHYDGEQVEPKVNLDHDEDLDGFLSHAIGQNIGKFHDNDQNKCPRNQQEDNPIEHVKRFQDNQPVTGDKTDEKSDNPAMRNVPNNIESKDVLAVGGSRDFKSSRLFRVPTDLSYLDSIEPGEESQDDALDMVDKILCLNTAGMGLDNKLKEDEQSDVQSLPNAKGICSLAHLSETKKRHDQMDVFDWIDSQHDEPEQPGVMDVTGIFPPTKKARKSYVRKARKAREVAPKQKLKQKYDKGDKGKPPLRRNISNRSVSDNDLKITTKEGISEAGVNGENSLIGDAHLEDAKQRKILSKGGIAKESKMINSGKNQSFRSSPGNKSGKERNLEAVSENTNYNLSGIAKEKKKVRWSEDLKEEHEDGVDKRLTTQSTTYSRSQNSQNKGKSVNRNATETRRQVERNITTGNTEQSKPVLAGKDPQILEHKPDASRKLVVEGLKRRGSSQVKKDMDQTFCKSVKAEPSGNNVSLNSVSGNNRLPHMLDKEIDKGDQRSRTLKNLEGMTERNKKRTRKGDKKQAQIASKAGRKHRTLSKQKVPRKRRSVTLPTRKSARSNKLSLHAELQELFGKEATQERSRRRKELHSSELDKLQSSVNFPTHPETRQRRNWENIYVLFSHGLSDDIIKHQKKILARLGGHISVSVGDYTHFVADSFLRTRNMLEAMASGKYVVTSSWLESCGQVSYVVDEKKYILEDAKKEREFGFSMRISLMAAQRRPLLKDTKVLICQNASPDMNSIESVVKAAGGQVIQGDVDAFYQIIYGKQQYIVVASKDDHEFCIPLLEKGIKIYSVELILSGILVQALDFSRNQLFEDTLHQGKYLSRKTRATRKGRV